MTKSAAKVPVTKAKGKAKVPERTSAIAPSRPIEDLRREIDRLFENFGKGFWPTAFGRSWFDIEPFWGAKTEWRAAPPVDVVERDDAFEVTAELPGLDQKNVEVTVADDTLTIAGEKQEVKEEKKKGHHLKERRYGSFERSFRLPGGVDTDQIDARFEKGVLTVTLPKKPGAAKSGKKIEVKGE